MSNPNEEEEYQKFVESMLPHCRCQPYSDRPCDGVLAGGVCDDMGKDTDFREREEDPDDE